MPVQTLTPAQRAEGRKRSRSREAARERQQTILYYTALVCVCVNCMLETMGVSIKTPNYDRPTLLLGFGCVCLLMNDRDVLKKLRGKPYVTMYLFWAVFAVLCAVSSYMCKDIVPVYNPVTKNLLFQLIVFETLCLVMYSLAKNKTRQFVNFIFKMLLGLVILTDLQMFGGIHYSDGVFETYFIGTKFDLAYMHMNMMAMFFLQLKLGRRGKKDKKIPARLLGTFLIINVMVSLRADCNTGMLGSLLIAAIIFIADRSKRAANRLASVPFFAVMLAVSTLFAYYIFWILEQPIVQYIIVDKLGRSLTLTGRTDIFSAFPEVMKDNWTWGFGFGNSYPVCWSRFGYTDVQNAILQWVLQIGVPATAAMCVMFCVIVRWYSRKRSITTLMPVMALLYVYILLGTVEITVNYNFWLFIMLLLMLSCEDQMTREELEKARSARRGERKRGRLRGLRR